MRLAGLAAVIGLACTTPACTLGGIGVASTTVAVHNAIADSSDRWNYTTPLLVGAALGFAVDIWFLWYMSKQWGKPMT